MHFADDLLAWFDQHGRHDLPWQHPRTPYRVWLAEVMLQQTQVATVIPYYQRFLNHFPMLIDLANADIDQVLAQWAGLGYYSRARNLHRSARICRDQHAGQVPATSEQLRALPGIGRSTAAAILAQAYGQREAILDGNVKRVLARFHAIDQWPGLPAIEQRLWQLADRHTPKGRVTDYTQAIMDLGASVCTRSKPDCPRCPLRSDCQAYAQGMQAQWPLRKPTRQRPQQHALLLWLRDNEQRSLLQRRPPSGIWGGLWCLPQLPLDTLDSTFEPTKCGSAQVRAWCEARAMRTDSINALPAFHHDFSHFRLHLYPRVLQVSAPATIADNDSTWFSGDQLQHIGMPAPIQKLLRTIPKTQAL